MLAVHDQDAFAHGFEDAAQKVAVIAQLVQGARKVGGQVIESPAKLADLVAGIDPAACIEIASGHASSDGGQLAQAAR